MPRSTCKQSIIHCYWLGAVGVRVQVPEAGRRFSHPSVPSHRASWLRQPSLGETAKTFPSDGECWGGLWCSFEQSIPKTSSVELPFSHGQSLTTQERSVGDRLRMNSVYLAAAFTINSLSLSKYDKAARVGGESSVSLLISFAPFAGFRYRSCVDGRVRRSWIMQSHAVGVEACKEALPYNVQS